VEAKAEGVSDVLTLEGWCEVYTAPNQSPRCLFLSLEHKIHGSNSVFKGLVPVVHACNSWEAAIRRMEV
jgi:hypothetical protein